MRWRTDVVTHLLFMAAALVAWGALVWFAIELGSRARGGEQRAWWLMGAISVAAIACLFVALMIAARTLRTLQGTKTAPAATHSHAAARHEPPPVPPPSVNPYAVEEQGDTAERPRPASPAPYQQDHPQAG